MSQNCALTYINTAFTEIKFEERVTCDKADDKEPLLFEPRNTKASPFLFIQCETARVAEGQLREPELLLEYIGAPISSYR